MMRWLRRRRRGGPVRMQVQDKGFQWNVIHGVGTTLMHRIYVNFQDVPMPEIGHVGQAVTNVLAPPIRGNEIAFLMTGRLQVDRFQGDVLP